MINDRAYHRLWVWKKDRRCKTGERKFYLRDEWLDELPYVKWKYLTTTKRE